MRANSRVHYAIVKGHMARPACSPIWVDDRDNRTIALTFIKSQVTCKNCPKTLTYRKQRP